MLDTNCRKYIQPIIAIGANFFIKLGLSANQVTIIALFFGLLSGVLVYFELAIEAVICLWFSGYLDAVDGTVARKKGSTAFGTVMDITFDRIVEIALILGLALRFSEQTLNFLFLSVSIIISMTIFLTTGSMANKKSEKSFYYQAGVAERTEGFVMFTLMILFPKYIVILIYLFTGMIIFTALQRALEAKKILDN